MAEHGKLARKGANPVQSDARCAVCARPVMVEFRPFCSRRCADVDLGRWLTGEYRIPGPAQEEPEDEDEIDEI